MTERALLHPMDCVALFNPSCYLDTFPTQLFLYNKNQDSPCSNNTTLFLALSVYKIQKIQSSSFMGNPPEKEILLTTILSNSYLIGKLMFCK